MRILQKSSQLSISQYVCPFAESSASQCVLPSVRLLSIIRSFIHSVSQSVNQPANQFIGQLVSQSGKQPESISLLHMTLHILGAESY